MLASLRPGGWSEWVLWWVAFQEQGEDENAVHRSSLCFRWRTWRAGKGREEEAAAGRKGKGGSNGKGRALGI